MSSVTVSAKIPKSLKKRLDDYGIKVSEVVRRALDYEVKKAEESQLAEKLEKISGQLRGKISEKDVVKTVRAIREKE